MRTWFRKPATIPIEEQIARLADNGVRLRAGVSSADIVALPERSTLESAGYRATLCALGAARTDGAGRTMFFSNDVWFFDSACINGPGDYAFIVTRIAAMLPDEFVARNASDSILLENWRASVSFDMGDSRLHWTQRVMDNWLDETLLLRINQLIDGQENDYQDQSRHLWQIPLEGQHRLIIAATPADGRRLAHNCGLALRNII